jgi:hypothetical protein
LTEAFGLARSYALAPGSRWAHLKVLDSGLHAKFKEWSGDHYAARVAFEAVFYFGLARRAEAESNAGHQVGFDTLAQGRLTLAWLYLEAERRREFAGFQPDPDQASDLARAWSRSTAGASAAASVAEACLRATNRVYLPFPNDDLHHKIDLIVTDGGAERGLLFQIKSSTTWHGAVCVPSWSAEGLFDEEFTRRFADGVAAYAERVGGDWNGYAIVVGNRRDRDGASSEPDPVALAVRSLLARHNLLGPTSWRLPETR